MDEASRLHFGKFNVSKFMQFHYAGPHEVSSTLQLKKQLCHKMFQKTNCFSSSNLTAMICLILIWSLGRELRCVNITGHFLMNMRTRQSPLCIHISGENFQLEDKECLS